MDMIVQTFQLGSSTVVTLPKKLGIQSGQRLKIKKTGQNIVLKKEKMNSEDIHKLVDRLSGGLNLKYHPTPEEINKALDKRYEEMLP